MLRDSEEFTQVFDAVMGDLRQPKSLKNHDLQNMCHQCFLPPL